jgi:hypothetical protein
MFSSGKFIKKSAKNRSQETYIEVTMKLATSRELLAASLRTLYLL